MCFPRFEVKPSRQAEGAASLQAQWGFEELGSQDEQLGRADGTSPESVNVI